MNGTRFQPVALSWLLALCLFGSTLTALGRVYHVAPDGDDANDGAGWTHAKRTIQAAVDAAEDWDTVLVTNGLYDTGGRPEAGGRESYRVCIEKPIKLISVNGPEHTFIAGNYSATNPVRGIYIGGFAMIEGFTITNCYATRASPYGSGNAGIVMNNPATMVANCLITGCFSEYCYIRWGSGVVRGPGTLMSCRIVGNNNGASSCLLVDSQVLDNGGIGAEWCELSGCVIKGNSEEGVDHCKGDRCIIANNAWGGAIASSLTNCLLRGNTGGGALYSALVNCTVVGNSDNEQGGGVINCQVRNCIIVSNTAPIDANWSVTESYVGGPRLEFECDFTCTYPLPAGDGNIAADPCFVDYSAGDFHLGPNSPCIDWGETKGCGARDLDGAARIQHDVVDMGAYESPYTVQRTLYVSTNGTHRPPFRTWETAATNFQEAFDLATEDDTILVSDGSYSLSSSSKMKNMQLQSENGPKRTFLRTAALCLSNALDRVSGFTIQGGSNSTCNSTCVMLYQGIVSNCIIRYGSPGVIMESGLVTRCTIRENVGDSIPGEYMYSSAPLGGGIRMSGGVVEDCLIESNRVALWSQPHSIISGGYGGGIHMSGGILRRSRMINNNAPKGCGGGVHITGGTMENCLITDNHADQGSGGGIYAKEVGHVEINHCTIGFNNADFASGLAVGTATHSDGRRLHIANSVFVDGVDCLFYDLPSFAHCFYFLPLPGVGNIVGDPQFVNTSQRNLQLLATSPCIDAGSNDCGVAEDLLGVPRPLDGNGDGTARCDMGCYEFVSQAGDSDGDGVTDWRELNELGSLPRLRDSDGDGQNDYEEFIAGTSASDPDDSFQVNNSPAQDETGWILSWVGASGRLYDVMVSTNLCGSWSGAEQGTDLPGIQGLMTYTARINSAMGIYSVKVRAILP
jgi:hypothetical protein